MSDGPILTPGETCWRIEHAERLACIVDAAPYFRFAKSAMLHARRRIMLIGWDFDSRILLEPQKQTLDGPNSLGAFLDWLIETRPDLEIYLLKWNIGAITAMTRGERPAFVSNMLSDRRMHIELDATHPVGASHHQKIVVIDDELAFCGGIDMTVDRWDTPDHLDDNPNRTTANGGRNMPWHDATTAVDGAVARAIGELARARWKAATKVDLLPVDAPAAGQESHIWPADLEPTMVNVDVAIARTIPEMPEHSEVREIESLYLAAIAAASHTLYIESQYLASHTITDALARRLREPAGPEIVVVLPRHADSWAERKVMDGARYQLLHLLWDADAHSRLGVYYPVTTEREPIYVHAKVLVVDDRLLRVGSSNLNNRSMGFDTECDIAVEVTSDTIDKDRLIATISDVRRGLVCEHLGVTRARFDEQYSESGPSLLATIDALVSNKRTLMKFEPETIAKEKSLLAGLELMNPDRSPQRIWDTVRKTVISG